MSKKAATLKLKTPAQEALETFDGIMARLEPGIDAMIAEPAALVSIAISLKRIADVLQGTDNSVRLAQDLGETMADLNRPFAMR